MVTPTQGRTARRLAQVVAVQPLGQGIGEVTLRGEGLASGVACGRFAMLQAPRRPDCILLRPFSYFAIDGADQASFLVKDVGKGTAGLLQAAMGTEVVVLGPLGSTFPDLPGEVWVAAGGVGAAPFGLLRHTSAVRVLFGARTAGEAGFATALRRRGAEVEVATDDGSSGYRGNVVGLLTERLGAARPAAIFTCGPTPMMAAVADVAARFAVACWVSLEERMGCGIGICRGCAHRDARGTWRCICVDGPVYDAREIFA